MLADIENKKLQEEVDNLKVVVSSLALSSFKAITLLQKRIGDLERHDLSCDDLIFYRRCVAEDTLADDPLGDNYTTVHKITLPVQRDLFEKEFVIEVEPIWVQNCSSKNVTLLLPTHLCVNELRYKQDKLIVPAGKCIPLPSTSIKIRLENLLQKYNRNYKPYDENEWGETPETYYYKKTMCYYIWDENERKRKLVEDTFKWQIEVNKSQKVEVDPDLEVRLFWEDDPFLLIGKDVLFEKYEGFFCNKKVVKFGTVIAYDEARRKHMISTEDNDDMISVNLKRTEHFIKGYESWHKVRLFKYTV